MPGPDIYTAMLARNGGRTQQALPYRKFPIPRFPGVGQAPEPLLLAPRSSSANASSRRAHSASSSAPASELSMFAQTANHDLHLATLLSRYSRIAGSRWETKGGGRSGARSARSARTHSKKKGQEKKSRFEEINDQIQQVISLRNETVDKYLGKDVKGDGNPVRGEASHGRYLFYRVFVPAGSTSVKFEVENVHGRTEVFVSLSDKYFLKPVPQVGGKRRSDQGSNWWRVGKTNTLIITSQDNNWKQNSFYYVSVLSNSNQCVFMLRTTIIMERRRGGIDTSSSSSSSTGVKEPTAPETQNPRGRDTSSDSKETYNLNRTNIRKRIHDKLQKLKESPMAMNDFNNNIKKIKKQQRKERLGSRSARGRNFERENIIKQTQTLRQRALQDKRRHKQHNSHVMRVVARKYALEDTWMRDVRESILAKEAAMTQRREDERLQEIRAHELRYAARWLTHMQVVRAGTILAERAKQHFYMVKMNKLKSWAIIKIQRWVRRHFLSKRREREAMVHFQEFRTFMLMCAFNLSAVKRERSANIIIWLLEKNANVNPLSKKARNYTRKVKLLQRVIRRWKTTRTAKMEMWRIQWSKMIQKLVLSAKLSNSAKKIPAAIRDHLLHQHMEKLQAIRKAEMPAYFLAHKNWLVDWREETQRRKVMMGDKSAHKEIKKPRKPHIPPVLKAPIMKGLILAGVKMVHEVNLLESKSNRRKTRLGGRQGSVLVKNSSTSGAASQRRAAAAAARRNSGGPSSDK